MEHQPTVYVVDDDAALRESLAFLIESVGLQVRTFESADDFLTGIAPDAHGCLLLDVRMPGMSGLELQARLGDHGITLPVLILTGHGDVPMAVRAMKAGAFDFFEKPFNDQALLDRINRAIEHDGHRRQTNGQMRAIAERLDRLSPREREVLDLVVSGRLNKEIAADLGVSEKTVESHRSKVMFKMEANSLVELVRLVTLFRMGGE